MNRFPFALCVVLALVSCSSGYKTPPNNLDDACSIVTDRPEYLRAFRKTQKRWGVPVHVQMATIYQESKFVSNARTPHQFVLGVIPMGRQTTAFGYGQALDGTWDEYRKETRSRRARRDNIHDAADFMGWYMAKSRDRLGISLGDTRNQYLAYHEGRTGYSRGSYHGKPWLLRVASEVETRSHVYSAQLSQCGV